MASGHVAPPAEIKILRGYRGGVDDFVIPYPTGFNRDNCAVAGAGIYIGDSYYCLDSRYQTLLRSNGISLYTTNGSFKNAYYFIILIKT